MIVNVSEAKANLSRLLDLVYHGEHHLCQLHKHNRNNDQKIIRKADVTHRHLLEAQTRFILTVDDRKDAYRWTGKGSRCVK